MGSDVGRKWGIEPALYDPNMGNVKRNSIRKPLQPLDSTRFYFFGKLRRGCLVPGTGLEPASLLRRRIFITLLLSKPMLRAQPVRALDYAFAIFRSARAMRAAPDLRRPPSSLYTFLGNAKAWLGVASMHRASGVSPNLKGSTPAVSNRALKHLSPLCLPISSPRQGRTAFYHRSGPATRFPARRPRTAATRARKTNAGSTTPASFDRAGATPPRLYPRRRFPGARAPARTASRRRPSPSGRRSLRCRARDRNWTSAAAPPSIPRPPVDSPAATHRRAPPPPVQPDRRTTAPRGAADTRD